MKILDGRNSNQVPQVIELNELPVKATYLVNDIAIYALSLDEKIVPCVSIKNNAAYDCILCGSYKTIRGFDKWINRFYSGAKKIN